LGPSSKMNFDNKHDLSRSDLLAAHVKHFYDVHKNFFGKYIPTRDEVMFMAENSILSGSLGNHHGLFLPTVLGMANDDQRNWWLPRILTLRMIGCYCQTELGHGSNVRGLRTTATYDKKTEEFVLDTPTLQASKWWPGALGKVCTHAAVYAQLIIDGKEHGVHVFMLQIRDENHRPFKGIEVGDLGPKIGDGANDTGFLRLNSVRIPREMMFGRHSHVSKEGKYVKAQKKGNEDDSKLHYATMMFTRGSMTRQAGAYLAQACTIATRYNCIRRQGFIDTSRNISYKTEENKLMDYQIQQYRIFKQIGWAYAMKFIGYWLIETFKQLSGESQDNYVITNLDALPEISSTTAGFKAIATSLCADGIEDLRKCCGGNGYLLSSGIAGLASDYVWRVTAEGDWIILMLQAARFIVKTIQQTKKGKKTTGPYEYLGNLADKNFSYSNYKPKDELKVENYFDLEYLERLFRYYALCIVGSVGLDVAEKAEKIGNFDKAARENQVELINAVKVHSYYFTIVRFREVIKSIDDADIKAVLTKLACLLACSIITETQWGEIISLKELKFARNAIAELLSKLRPDAVALVDSFDIPDRVLCSAIGKYDGNIYEELFEAAKRSEINQVDPFVGYDEMRKYLDLKFLAKGNKAPQSKL
jgi:acyl-CoA oxidase